MSNLSKILSDTWAIICICGVLVSIIIFTYEANSTGVINSARLDKLEKREDDYNSMRVDIALIKQSLARQEKLLTKLIK